MEDRTVTISALSKTYSVTGWRVGWAVAAPALMDGIRPVHDFLTVAAAAPLQIAGITALGLPDDYYSTSLADYHDRRATMMRILDETGFIAQPPAGAYYVMADISHLGFDDDVIAATSMVEKIGVATVPALRSSPNPRTAVICFGSRSARSSKRSKPPANACAHWSETD